MRSLLTRSGAFAALIVLLAALFAACGGSSGGGSASDEPVDLDAGRQLFQTTCRACHALADAKAAGVFGTDLDLLQPDAERVREQIESGGGGMPDHLLEGDDAELVAQYVAAVAGQGEDQRDAAPSQRGSTRATPDA